MQVDVHQIKHRVAEKADLIHRLQSELGKAIVGQHEMISRLLVGLLTHGHILLEGVPGPGEDHGHQVAGPGPLAPASSGSSSRPTCCRPTWSAP